MNVHHFSISPLLVHCYLFSLVIMIGIPLSLSTPQLYKDCRDTEFECGNISAGYPFSGGNRRIECGLVGLQLNCNAGIPTIGIVDVEYQVLEIDTERQILKIARKDLIQKRICGPQIANSTLDYKLFEMVNTSGLRYTYTNITLLYDCPSTFIPPNFAHFTCDTIAGSRAGYKNVAVMLGDNDRGGCRASITVPILQTNSEGGITDNFTSLADLEKVLETGFEVQWKTKDREACMNCTQTGGECAFGQRNQTICYCPFPFDNWVEATYCPAPPSLQADIKSMNLAFVTGLALAGVVLVGIGIVMLIFLCRQRNQTNPPSSTTNLSRLRDNKKVRALIAKYGSLAPKRYGYSDVKKMTRTFKDKLGQGGYGSVYKGKLPDGKLIAVKVLSESRGDGEEFINEILSISRTSHVNIVKLVGFCYEKSKRALIYEYMPNGSLDRFIYDKKHQDTSTNLEWRILHQITLGIARGLEYLHQGCNTRILHFDIKPHNILLDEGFRPRISDFGLAKLCQMQESTVSMLGARGTAGYMAPEVYNRSFGGVSYKSDVYSFGMMVLEMAGRRRNNDANVSHTSEIYFPHWIFKQLEVGQDLKLHGIVTEDDEQMARKMVLVGLWCIQMNPWDRPSMTKVVEMLEGSLESLQTPPQPCLSPPAREQQIYCPSSFSYS